jgi:putative N-acetyltransferase (TIGR04045 family)
MISSSAPTAEIVVASESLDEHFAVRRQGFVEQQALFVCDDRDAWDECASTVHVVAVVDGAVVGTVRLYPLGSGLWKGDRLAVLPDARVHRLGGELVDFAVRTAGALGGARMVAQVQVANVRFFERLGWVRDGDAAVYCGVMHQPMAIGL